MLNYLLKNTNMAINSSLYARRPHHGSHIVFVFFIFFIEFVSKEQIISLKRK
jgi:hypothetical protein